MAPRNQPAQRGRSGNDDVIEGEVVEATTKALAKSGSGSPGDLDASLAVALSEAEINQQIATAHRFPRSVHRALENIRELATLDTATATECNYALPRGRDDDGKAKVIEGPSIRLAELIAQQWGNNRVAARVIAVDRKEKFIEAEGIYHDLETNSAVSARVRRRISDKRGNLFNDDMIVVTGNAAASIALRNAILRGVPKPVWRKAYEAVKAVIRGDQQTLGARRVELLSKFKSELGIDPRTVFRILAVDGEQDIGLDEIVTAAGFYSALRNNEVTVEDLLNEIKPPAGAKTLGGAFDNVRKPPANEETAHDPATGEVREPETAKPAAKPAAAAKGAEVVIEGPAPAGVIHFLAGQTALNEDGKRITFKDGVRFSAAKPSADLPTYTDLTPLPEDQEPGDANGAAPEPSQPSDPADDDSAAAGDATPASPPGDEPGEIEFDDDADAEGLEGVSEAQDRLDAENDAGQDSTPPEFVEFRETISGKDSWLTAKAALRAFQKTDAYKTASAELRLSARLATREVVEALRDAGKDPVTPSADPEFYALWVEGAQPAEVDRVWQSLIRSKAYGALADQLKDALADATEKARG